MANSVAATDEAIIIVFDATGHGSASAAERIEADADALASAQASADETGADVDPWKVQADLEDQTLPVPVATLPLDWQPFPHLYPHVSGSESAFIGLLRPPPAV